MILKLSFNVIKGMRLDISPSKASPEYIFDARNIRLTARGNDTLLSISNELGTSECSPTDGYLILGIVLGYCVLNKFLIVFSRSHLRYDKTTEYITRVYYYNNKWISDILYSSHSYVLNENGELELKEVSGRLNLGDNIQTLGVYENENILKVYWVDGVNLPRVINIVKDWLLNTSVLTVASSYTNTSFDFVPTLSLKETVTIDSLNNTNGKFSAGVIQYAFTYYTKYGLESNIFYTTDLYNISYSNRGGSPEDKINKAFRINIKNLDPKFTYLRIYSIHRSSLDATPNVKRVTDINYIFLDLDAVIEDIPVFLRFNNTPIIYEDYKNSPNTYKIIDSAFTTLQLPSGIHHGSGDFYVFKKVDYPNAVFLIDYLKITFSPNATDDTLILISKYTNVSGPGGEGRLITTNDDTVLAKITLEAVSTEINFTDTNNIGESLDPTVLLYIGGEDILAKTINQKDNTLFLGNINITRPNIPLSIKDVLKSSQSSIGVTYRSIVCDASRGEYYSYGNLLNFTNPTTFKNEEHYRLGVQFLYKNGKWSEPIVISSLYVVHMPPSNNIDKDGNIVYNVPLLTFNIPYSVCQDLRTLGFVKARPLIVNPTVSDRRVLLLGIVCPTIKVSTASIGSTQSPNIECWSSWFLRTISHETDEISNFDFGDIPMYKHGESIISNSNRRREEIEGFTTTRKSITVNQNIVTFHSPDIEFDNSILLLDLLKLDFAIIGTVNFESSCGDIDILTSSPSIGGAGVMKYSIKVPRSDTSGCSARSLISGFYYRDYLVNNYEAYKPDGDRSLLKNFMIYPWQSSGSLNNDIIRPADKGARSAVLKRKVISNIKFSNKNTLAASNVGWNDKQIQIFNSNELSITKVNNYNYFGNVDTLLVNSNDVYKLIGNKFTEANANIVSTSSVNIGEDFKVYTPSVRIKYKSTPHIVIGLGKTTDGKDIILPNINNDFNNSSISNVSLATINIDNIGNLPNLFLGEIRCNNIINAFGGDDEVAYKNNLWLPSGPSVLLSEKDTDGDTTINYLHGDCYYQRYDCLKTYPFTQEDENSIVEIGSFMVETRVNIDGRYDRNRGLESNLNITPLNFNLLNNIYTLKDNFFNYRILDKDFYKLNNFPNTITWSKEKSSGEDVDTWTNITMANTFDVDGNLGEIVSIENYNNELYCFLDKGLSRILFNNRVQIPTGDNIPIEISNGYKVLGKVYISNTVGCLNLKAIKVTPNGIYFSDLNNSGIYLLNQLGMLDISTSRGFTNWVKKCQPNKIYYDTNNGDLYLIGNGYLGDNAYKNCLCFSEKLNEFTSFMDYNYITAMFNIDNSFYSLYDKNVGMGTISFLYEMFSGDYNYFFGETEPYYISYIANLNPTNDKIFNTLEFRGDTLGTEDYKDKLVKSSNTSKTPNICPFNKVTVWNEYQEGEATLSRVWGKPSNLKEKFRTWRVNIPRDKSNNRDRIRNPWAYIKLEGSNNTNRMLLHDLLVYYYDNSIYGLGNLRLL